jgi:spore germination cell wall hydrolase CwlJ-like protein
LASAFSLALTLTFAVLGTSGAKARPQDPQVRDIEVQAPVVPVALPTDITVQPLHDAVVDPAVATEADLTRMTAGSLPELVDMMPVPETLSPDIECLAGAVYFEAKSESLAGQLAVGRVVVARTESGHFPSSYCGVVYQPSQFSFVRRGTMPTINRTSPTWRKAVKIALIAHNGKWKSPAEGALFFHAARVGPVSGKTRIARIDNHVFYR